MGIISDIWGFFVRIWNAVKRFFIRLLQFSQHIISWFKNPSRLRQLEQDKRLLAVAIKERLENGNYGVVKCLYNKQTEGVEEKADGIASEQVDAETQKHFGNQEMIVLE
ncbi:hypothetical protein [Helicobacter felis]|uniref:hypothetical protein n=1 Tax=Helicobacter felis TaxID=214 RepID=UPI000CF1A4CD|nr:hypothetical protein [Helicobacter felis]